MNETELREEWKEMSHQYAIKAVDFGHENAMIYDMMFEIRNYWLSKLASSQAEIKERLIKELMRVYFDKWAHATREVRPTDQFYSDMYAAIEKVYGDISNEKRK